MQSNEIDIYLQALDEALSTRSAIKKPARLVVVGGVYMMLFLKNRTSTKDVDVIPLSFPDTMNPSDETKAFRAAIWAVARRFHLKQDWMNDIVASFSPETGPLSLWRAYPNLEIYIPQVNYILALKLLAGRDRDEDDILALCEHIGIKTREQAQTLVDRYASKEWQMECNLTSTLDALF
ncbi:DUF6036 family nucleotidyltransferase [Ktedonospora formicarum]|uniref:DUF6036 domain-containing protein n=1 Tax=Ktedonospora formicarum TaxID=2778364 RepID=A0A8J3MW70_9CHLR|nr:DUF6036 family nucleotidyltransferase [Ktedonospora formicarum]GHO47255.1 hypothetical protein KSX_54180 [Ktedonospora formicarum]